MMKNERDALVANSGERSSRLISLWRSRAAVIDFRRKKEKRWRALVNDY